MLLKKFVESERLQFVFGKKFSFNDSSIIFIYNTLLMAAFTFTLLSLILNVINGYRNSEELKQRPFNKKAWTTVVLLIAGFLVALGLELNNYIDNKLAEKKAKYSQNVGFLEPKPTYKKDLKWVLATDTIIFKDGIIDLDKAYITYIPLKAPKNVITVTHRVFEGVHFKAWLENGIIKLNTTIRDTTGNPIAQISGNDWLVAPKPFAWDRNFDNTAFEVKDNFGQIVFQVEIIDNNIKMQGKFVKPDGTLAVAFGLVDSNGKQIWPIIAEFEKGTYKLNAMAAEKGVGHIYPIFKYPSDKYKGERVNL